MTTTARQVLSHLRFAKAFRSNAHGCLDMARWLDKNPSDRTTAANWRTMAKMDFRQARMHITAIRAL